MHAIAKGGQSVLARLIWDRDEAVLVSYASMLNCCSFERYRHSTDDLRGLASS
jgi:hypothetical protein